MSAIPTIEVQRPRNARLWLAEVIAISGLILQSPLNETAASVLRQVAIALGRGMTGSVDVSLCGPDDLRQAAAPFTDPTIDQLVFIGNVARRNDIPPEFLHSTLTRLGSVLTEAAAHLARPPASTSGYTPEINN